MRNLESFADLMKQLQTALAVASDSARRHFHTYMTYQLAVRTPLFATRSSPQHQSGLQASVKISKLTVRLGNAHSTQFLTSCYLFEPRNLCRSTCLQLTSVVMSFLSSSEYQIQPHKTRRSPCINSTALKPKGSFLVASGDTPSPANRSNTCNTPSTTR